MKSPNHAGLDHALGKLLPRRERVAAVVCGLALLPAVVAFAESESDKAKAAAPAPKPTVKPAAPAAEGKTELTGSHLKQKVRKGYYTTDSAFNVSIIDQKQIERSGAMTVQELLRKQPYTR
jgi:outer membrane cobalamin receptor